MDIKATPISIAWRRLAAFAIDFAIVRLFILVYTYISSSLRLYFSGGQDVYLHKNPEDFTVIIWITLGMHVVIWMGYFLLFENSRLRATPGKIITKLAIKTLNDNDPSFGCLLVRNTYKLLPIALFQLVGVYMLVQQLHEYGAIDGMRENIAAIPATDIRSIASGFVIIVLLINIAMMFFTARKRALHDFMAGTVVQKADGVVLEMLIKKLKTAANNILTFIQKLRKANFSNHKGE